MALSHSTTPSNTPRLVFDNRSIKILVVVGSSRYEECDTLFTLSNHANNSYKTPKEASRPRKNAFFPGCSLLLEKEVGFDQIHF